jgi:predicted ATPase/DNA-binding winged helix-turn-helix (wHTH) protein
MVTPFQSEVQFHFGMTTVNPGRRELSHGGVRISIGDRAFELLLLLIEQRSTVVNRDRIMEVVWQGRVIGDNTLEGQVCLLRRSLGRDRGAIHTVHGRGYQFVGDLVVETSAVQKSVNTVFPTAPDLRVRGLPAPVSPLIGRETQLAEVTALVRSRRLVTLVGAGGVGKSRLAIETARQVSPDFIDGVVLIDLAAISLAEYVPATVAVAFGFPADAGSRDLGKLAAGICDRRRLIVVDNCEHLIESAAELLELLLQIAPASTVVATSREVFRVPGEFVYRVPPLDLPMRDEAPDAAQSGAIQLFLERTGFKTDTGAGAWMPIIARICRQLDGIPLAIELAAACMTAFGIQEVADRLDDRFEMLCNGARTVLPRQQTLRATVDWSYVLLPPHLQTMLARLSVFAGTFTMDFAQCLIGGSDVHPHQVSAAIAELVEKSLVCAVPCHPHVHYRLLHTIRAYGRERLEESGTSRDWFSRHARHVLDVFRRAEKSAEEWAQEWAEPDWARAFGIYQEDLRAAIEWSFSSDETTVIGVELAEYQLQGPWGRWSQAYLNAKPSEALMLAARFSTVAAIGAIEDSSCGPRSVLRDLESPFQPSRSP